MLLNRQNSKLRSNVIVEGVMTEGKEIQCRQSKRDVCGKGGIDSFTHRAMGMEMSTATAGPRKTQIDAPVELKNKLLLGTICTGIEHGKDKF